MARKKTRLTEDDIMQLKRRYGSASDAELASHLGVRREVVQRAASRLRLAKDKHWLRQQGVRSRMPRWTADDERYLANHYPDTDAVAVARALKRSVKSVVSKAHQLGVRKTDERLSEMGRQNGRKRYR